MLGGRGGSLMLSRCFPNTDLFFFLIDNSTTQELKEQKNPLIIDLVLLFFFP